MSREGYLQQMAATAIRKALAEKEKDLKKSRYLESVVKYSMYLITAKTYTI
jgi:hypothetical protein